MTSEINKAESNTEDELKIDEKINDDDIDIDNSNCIDIENVDINDGKYDLVCLLYIILF